MLQVETEFLAKISLFGAVHGSQLKLLEKERGKDTIVQKRYAST